jgi:trehalose 6-phosphate phosphatase
LRLEPGKLVIELRAPIDVDKGSTVEEVVTAYALHPVVYAGDDLGDAPAFRAIRRLRGHGLLVLHGDETPPELKDLCSEHIEGVEGFAVWLERLAVEISR